MKTQRNTNGYNSALWSSARSPTKYRAVLTALCFATFLLVASGALAGITVTLDGPGAVGGDTIICGQPVTFNINLLNDAGEYVTGITNGFRIYSPTGAEWETPTYETASGLDTYFDGGVFLNGFSVDGSGADTIGLGGVATLAPGVPNGYDDVILTIATQMSSLVDGDTLCIDSCFYPPTGDWLWATASGSVVPSWGGPYCYTTKKPPSMLYVDEQYIAGPDCCWQFDFGETVYGPSQIADSVVMVIQNTNVAVTSATGCSGTRIWTTSGGLPAVTWYTPNLPSDPCTGTACFDGMPKGSGVKVEFNCYKDDYICAFNDKHNPTFLGTHGECDCFWAPNTMSLWFPFDNDPYPDAKNLRNWKNGVYVGAQTVTGHVGDAASFDGINDRIDVDFYAAMYLRDRDFTVDAWVKRTGPDIDGVRLIVDCRELRGSDLRGFSFYLYNGLVSLQLADGTYDSWSSSLHVPADNQWYFVAVTVDRDEIGGMKFYLDNQPVDARTPTSHSGWLCHNPYDLNRVALTIGDRIVWPAGGASFNGCIDEVELYYRALSDTDVRAIYEAGEDGKCKTKPFINVGILVDWATLVTPLATGITNSKSTPQTYNWSIYGVDYGTGPVPTGFTPSSGTVTVESGDYVYISTQIDVPEFQLGSDEHSWFEIEVHNTGDDEYFYVQSSLGLTPGGLSASFPNAFAVAPLDTTVAGNNPIADLFPPIISNPGDITRAYDYRIIARNNDMSLDMDAISFNGEEPGVAVEGSFELAPGESTEIDLTGRFVATGHMSDYTIELQFDDAGEWKPAASMVVMCVEVQDYICGDVDGVEGINILDIVFLINYKYKGGLAPDPLKSADVNSDGLVNILDIVYLINYKYKDGPEPVCP